MNSRVADASAMVVIRPTGKLDAATSPALMQDIHQACRQSIQRVILDLRNVTYISSAGLQVLVTATKLIKSGMTICNVRGEIMDIFQLVHFDKLMRFCDDIDAAMAAE